MSRRVSALSTLVLSLVLSGCRESAPMPDAAKRIRAEYDDATGRLQRLEYDKNNDGKPDTWADMDGTRVVKIEVDDNGDGTPDRWEYYAPPDLSHPPDQPNLPLVERIERATKHDGKISRWEHFENGSLVRIEEDTNGDGRLDKWETYAGGSLSVLALDTKGRGRPDRRLMYRPDGSLDRIEADPTGSGAFAPIPR